MNDEIIINFKMLKRKYESIKIKQENKKILTKIALTSGNPNEYIFMNCMCKLSESSRKIADDPVLREKQKRLLRKRY